MADFKTLRREALERYESAYRIMIRITCQTAKLLKSRDFGASNRWFDTLIHYAPKLPESSDFNKDILICVPKINEGLTGVERHEGE